MNYSTKYPNAPIGSTPEFDLLKRVKTNTCLCGKETNWLNMAHQVYFCSEECLEEYEKCSM